MRRILLLVLLLAIFLIPDVGRTATGVMNFDDGPMFVGPNRPLPNHPVCNVNGMLSGCTTNLTVDNVTGASITGAPVLFVTLGLSRLVNQTDGTIVYCCNCLAGSMPCATDGSLTCDTPGAVAIHIAGAWDCSALAPACKGAVTLSSGTGTFANTCVTLNSVCNGVDVTTYANAVCGGHACQASAGSVAVTGTGTDNVIVNCE